MRDIMLKRSVVLGCIILFLFGLTACQEKSEDVFIPAPSPTIIPTATTAPTESAEQTVAPTVTVEPTKEPVAPSVTVEAVPTEVIVPTATIAPTATSTPVPTATNTPTPTSTPTPTPSPLPHVHNWVEKSIQATCALEGKTWEECTECGIVRNELIFPKEEHKNRSHNWASLPTVEKEGIYETICNDCGKVINVIYAPKLTPTPSPTPVPDANNPRLVLSEKMGDDITFEFWDNGYLYVKGTGKTYDKKESYHWRIISEFKGKLTKEFLSSLKHVVVEEGVTYLGENVFADFSKYCAIKTVELPDSLTAVSNGEIGPGLYAYTIYGYCDGRECVLTRTDSSLKVDVSFIVEANDEETMQKYSINVEWK